MAINNFNPNPNFGLRRFDPDFDFTRQPRELTEQQKAQIQQGIINADVNPNPNVDGPFGKNVNVNLDVTNENFDALQARFLDRRA